MWIVPFYRVVTKGKQISVFTFRCYRTLSLHYHTARIQRRPTECEEVSGLGGADAWTMTLGPGPGSEKGGLATPSVRVASARPAAAISEQSKHFMATETVTVDSGIKN